MHKLNTFVLVTYGDRVKARSLTPVKGGMKQFFRDFGRALKEIFSWSEDGDFISFYDFIIDYSIYAEKVLDLETMTFSKDVINSAQTDMEILTATIDLLSILITGNQVVMPRIENLR